jgi:hypothetical protein
MLFKNQRNHTTYCKLKLDEHYLSEIDAILMQYQELKPKAESSIFWKPSNQLNDWVMCYVICHKINKATFKRLSTGVDPGFQVIGGGFAHLKKIAPSGGRRENCWVISCEKSRFYAKKIIFVPILRGEGASGAPPPSHGSAPDL